MDQQGVTTLQQSLRQLLVRKGLAAVLPALKKALPEGTDKYNLVFQIEARLNAVNKDRIRGILSQEQLQVAYNRLNADVLEFITALQPGDFDKPPPLTPATAGKAGTVLYQVPHTMEMDGSTKYKCIVRLAYNEEMIGENLDLSKDTVLKPVRVSEVMEVELKDPGDSPAFDIRPVNSLQQFLDEYTYTEWQFMVRPIQPGTHTLLLMIAVREVINNRERRKEIVLEETIEVVTETAGMHVTEDTGNFQSAGYSFFYTTAPPRKLKGLAWFAGWLARLGWLSRAAIFTAVIAAGIWLTGLWLGWFKTDPPPVDLSLLNAQKDSSDWQTALTNGTDSAYLEYLQKHPEGIFGPEAQSRLDSLHSLTMQKPPPKDTTSTTSKPRTGRPDNRRSGFVMVEVKGGGLPVGSQYPSGLCTTKKVTIRDFKIGKYEITQADWQLIMGDNPAFKNSCDTCPVEQVTWMDAQEFIQKAGSVKGKKYRLPFELEWEFAAVGGNASMGFKYAGSNRPDEVAWFNTIKEHTHEVGLKKPNELEIYDMSGNVREWCQGISPPYLSCQDGSSDKKVLRGGSWVSARGSISVTNRAREKADHKDQQSGLRLIEIE